MGVLGDGPLFDLLASGHWQGEEEEVIARCVRAKAQLVSQDEKDQGKRQLLNLGHTLGHAIETRSNHLVSHGKAVAMGMAHITRLAVRLGFCPESCLEKVLEALKRNGLPVQSPYPWEELVAEIARDKKRAGALFTLVVPENIGACQLRQFSFAQLQEALPKAWE